ncbi:permease-like cell division protein FtsX [Amedibacterium intestinale]|uniref:permease-like cell division protein FtsX n=1 Tax=Amedibacterium intestinale TaxID=2583452 RepID=UPI000E200759
MISFFRALPKHIKTAFLSIFRHLAMSLSAISAVTVTLVLFAVFLIIAGNVSLFANNIENDVSIHVVLKENIEKQKDIEQAEQEIKQINGVRRVKFSDKDAELELMIKERGEELEMYRGKENPLSNAFFVYVNNADNVEKVTEEIKKLDFVSDAVYGGSSVKQMVQIINMVRTGGSIGVLLLTLLALFLISNTIKMTIYARNTEISIMRNVGAANWYIKVPFMLEGMIIGLLGSILPCLFVYFGYPYLYEVMGGQLVTSMFSLKEAVPFVAQVCGDLTLFGMLVGLIGSFFSTGKYLRWKR